VDSFDAPRAKLGRALASPTGVLILLPMLVLGAGASVMLLGRSATRDATASMARRQLAAQATSIQRDIAFALDQAEPLLVNLRTLADPALSTDDAAVRLRDIVVGRPGIANVSIAFPSGLLRGTYLDQQTGELRVQESRVGDHGTDRVNLTFATGRPTVASSEVSTYDPRTRPHYTLAVQARTRVWMPPHTFFTSHKTGFTVTEPIYGDGELRAVATVDFDVAELSSFIGHAPLEEARTIVFTTDGTVLAYPSVPLPGAASRENRLLRHEDFEDPAIEALFGALATAPDELRFLELSASDGDYLASVAPIGGKRAGVSAPIAWYLATLVPARTLLGPTHRLERQALFASGGALAIGLGVALLFAWNLIRMRRAVGAARERARSAEARAKELGSYRLVERLGGGGMGDVWRAEHRLLARQAAIKVVRADALRNPRHATHLRERFRREAQSLATMRSRHTIELYDYGVTDDGTFFYVMELLDGLDLEKLVREHGPLPAARVISLLTQACQSLAEAHDAGLLHRDIKPANLFACRAADEVDVLKVLDFGIVHGIAEPRDPAAAVTEGAATPSGRLTQVGVVVGTPGFIAPEQVFGKAGDGRSDLYALACVAWWLLVGNEVYPRTPEAQDSLRAHVQEPLPSLRSRMRGWLPDELDRLIASCLAKRPEDRPASAHAMIAALRAIAIPAEHAWTQARALAWWRACRPASVTSVVTPTSTERLLVARQDDAADDLALAARAITVVLRTDER
jgi:serine/threonine protein kinase